ncbi:hypothetical protein [Amycolatopsis sp. NPDC050768]
MRSDAIVASDVALGPRGAAGLGVVVADGMTLGVEAGRRTVPAA